MALLLCCLRTKTKMPYILRPTSKTKILDPQEIANAFSTYESLYNLQTDTTTIQPPPHLQDFFAQINLLTLSINPLGELNSPFMVQEITRHIDSQMANQPVQMGSPGNTINSSEIP